MISSMTGFGRARDLISPWGRISLEMRSVNHRFLDITLNLPEGFLYLEQKLKDKIAKRIKRGHIICRLDINTSQLKKPILNKYYFSLKQISREIDLKQDIDINTLAGLPGVWSMQSQSSLSLGWAQIRSLVKEALDLVIKRRQQEGEVLCKDLRTRLHRLEKILKAIKARFRKVIKQRLEKYKTEEEKNSFLKSSDINEEIVRLSSHLKNFSRCLKNNKAVGKELDFILQEMQRETNTIGAKSIDAAISKRIIAKKSEIEKMREMVQNVE
jgi:uncharacterized protein (TIGR00255 family)